MKHPCSPAESRGSIARHIERFRREHQELVRELRQLDRAITMLIASESKPAHALDILERLRVLLQEHVLPHCAQEKEVFSAALREMGISARQLQELLFEDRSLHREYRRLRKALSRQAPAEAVLSRDLLDLLRMGEQMIARVLEHIRSEESMLFSVLGDDPKRLSLA
jgi:hemerythrin-like domain-containing protein